MRITPPTKIFISKSQIHGYGVFANETIKQGELIEECPIFDLVIPFGEPSPVLIDYRFNWPQGTNEWKKQVVAWGYGSLYNHSNEPNAFWRSNLEKETFSCRSNNSNKIVSSIRFTLLISFEKNSSNFFCCVVNESPKSSSMEIKKL